jgi:hypothetical protein
MKHDFKQNDEQIDAFIEQYYENLEDSWISGLKSRESIAATKIPGHIVDDKEVTESYMLDIDTLYEKTHDFISNIVSKKQLKESAFYIDNYYKKNYKKSYSDERVFERVQSNYNTLINIYEEKKKQILK